MRLDELNEKILKLWHDAFDDYSDNNNTLFNDVKQLNDLISNLKGISPYLYGCDYDNIDVLFLGCNYSTKWTETINTKIEKLIKIKSDNSKRLHKEINAYITYLNKEKLMSLIPDEEITLDKIIKVNDKLTESLKFSKEKKTPRDYDFLVKMQNEMTKAILKGKETLFIMKNNNANKIFSHIDMFFLRHTNEADLKKLLVKPLDKNSNKETIDLNYFAQQQYDITLEAIEMIRPKLVVVIDAFVSEIVLRKLIADEEKGKILTHYNDVMVRNHKCNVILGGMIKNGRMDRWSLARFSKTIHDVLAKQA